jgi:hypothetical protein
MVGGIIPAVTEKASQSSIWLERENDVWKFLIREMKQRRVSYKELSRRLEALGIYESPDRLNRKVNRKRFSAAFFLACCQALQVESLVLGNKIEEPG